MSARPWVAVLDCGHDITVPVKPRDGGPAMCPGRLMEVKVSGSYQGDLR